MSYLCPWPEPGEGEIKKYLSIGKVYNNRQNVTFVVKSIDEIVEVLLPLFDKHPLTPALAY